MKTSHIFVVTFCALLLSACSTMEQEPRAKGARVAKIIVDAVAITSTKGNSYEVVRDDQRDEEDLAVQRDRAKLEDSLLAAGFTRARGRANAQLLVQFQYELRSPVTGKFSLGIITPYIHTLKVTAKKNKKLVWQTTITVKTELTEERQLTPIFIAAGAKWFGESSDGPVNDRVEYRNDSHQNE
jgi:hypothetical protein